MAEKPEPRPERQFRILSPEEVAQAQGSRRVILNEYREMIEQLEVGQWVEMSLRSNESVWTLRRRLTEAAQERGLKPRFHKAPEGFLRFHLDEKRS